MKPSIKLCFLLITAIQISGCDNTSPPIILITAPHYGDAFRVGDSISISALANASDGEIEVVQFYLNDSLIGEDNNRPYNYLFHSVDMDTGQYVISVIATDRKGNEGTDKVSINILHPIVNEGVFLDSINNVSYKWVRIGKQIWMAENLKSTKYQNGEPISYLDDDFIWRTSDTAAMRYYNDSLNNFEVFGGLYTALAVIDNRMICPAGWHVPSLDEWNELIEFLGGEFKAGGQLKSTSNLWIEPNVGAENKFGFNALPGGAIKTNGSPSWKAESALFWSSSGYYLDVPSYVIILDKFSRGVLIESYNQRTGLSIRCIKNSD